MPALLAARPDCWRCSERRPRPPCSAARSSSAATPRSRSNSASCSSCCARTSKKNSRASSATCRRTSSGGWPRAGLAFGRRLVTTAVTNAAEYFAHERADLVPRAEGEQFLRGVDALRDSVDRLAGPAATSWRGGAAPREAAGGGCGCWRSSACCCGTAWMTSCAPRTSTGRCASCSSCPPASGSSAAAVPAAASGCAWRSGARSDLREVRPGGVHAPRPAADRHRR